MVATVRVLGTFEARLHGVPADLGGPRQRSVLARLVAAQGRMVPADRLIEDLWPTEAPPRALAGIQSFVSHLRRALEPDRPPRTPAQVLVTSPPGYALRLPVHHVDAWRFDMLLDEAGELLEAADPTAARERAETALEEWRGPAYAEFADLPWAAAETSRLDERRRIAVERRAEAMLRLSAAVEAVPDLEAHAAANPLREDAWRLLALALYRTGRQGDALGALRRARAILAEELGVDPGPALQRLEAGILAQAPELDAPSDDRALVAPSLRLASEPPETAEVFFGRRSELAHLAGAARSTMAGRCRVVLVGGDAGVGKTALTERLARDLAGRGWTVGWGRVPETGGAPAAWPWAELLRELSAAFPPDDDLAGALAALLDDAGTGAGDGDIATARFRLHRALGDYLTRLTDRAPLLLVLDDLHWADEETLALLATLPGRVRTRPVLLVGTFRSPEVSDRLADTLAALARSEPLRVELGGLAAAEVTALVRATCTSPVDDATAATIAERTGGNPFFARETARLLDSEGALAATSEVPAGVSDVLRRRVARLPESAQKILRHAAVVGLEADLGVLIELSGGDEDGVLDAVEAGLVTGLVTEPEAGRVRFAHALVRDTLYAELSRARRARLHARVAQVLEGQRRQDIAAIAHHYLAAGTVPDKAVHYARLAATAAEARFAHRAAAVLWERAADTMRAAGIGRLRDRLELEIAVIRGTALAGDVMRARDRRKAAIAAARSLGDMELLARVIVSFDVPTLWTSREYGTLGHDVVEAAEEALAGLPAEAGELRVRLLTTLAIELEGGQAKRGDEASREALDTARRIGRPELLAVALNGRFLNAFRTADGLAERWRLATELLELATAHDLGLYAVLAHLQLQETAVARLDLDAAREHMDEGRRLAGQYDLPLLALIGSWLDGVRNAIAARFDEAERAYAETGEAIGRTGTWGSGPGMAFVAIFCLRLVQGRAGELVEEARWGWEQWRHVGATADIYALVLIAAGRTAEAREAVANAGPVRLDYFYDLVMALRGLRAIALGDRTLAGQMYEALLPYEGQIAGGATAVATIGPVAHVLGDLAVFLNRPADAAEHYRRAVALAERLGAPHWAAAARESLDDLGMPAA